MTDPFLTLVLIAVLLAGVAILIFNRRRNRSEVDRDEVEDRRPNPTPGGALPATAPSVYLGPDEKPLVTIQAVPAGPTSVQRHRLPKSQSLQIRSLLSAAPDLVVSTVAATQQSLKLVLSPELRAGLASGTSTMLSSSEVADGFRSVVVDAASGQVRGHGTLVQGINTASALSGLMNVGSFVFAQQHLADIDVRLKAIESGVARIERVLLDDVLSTIEADCEHLQRIASVVRSGEAGEADLATYRPTLEQIERDNLAAMKKLERRLEDLRKELEAVDVTRWFAGRLKKANGELEQLMAMYDEVFQGYVVACNTRLFASLVRPMVGLSESGAIGIVDGVLGNLRDVSEAHASSVVAVLEAHGENAVAKIARQASVDSAKAFVEELTQTDLAPF